jgi:hypothetical protein
MEPLLPNVWRALLILYILWLFKAADPDDFLKHFHLKLPSQDQKLVIQRLPWASTEPIPPFRR